MPEQSPQVIHPKTAAPTARVLDVTRLGRRAGQVLTGVDRVELAYVRALTQQNLPCFGLAKTSFGYVLIDPDKLRDVVERVCKGDMAGPDILSRLAPRLTHAQRCAQTAFRQAALARCRPHRVTKMLEKHVPRGFTYLNTGHSNLTDPCLTSISNAGGTISVFVHDVIPLEHPEFQRHGTADNFRDKMKAVRRHADLIIYNSQDTKDRSNAALSQWGDVPESHVAWLGVDMPDPVKPGPLQPQEPYFVSIGTIEPRKNIGFLLDLWAEMGDDAPRLLICGSRGWRNEDVFERLDALPNNSRVTEIGGVDDGTLTGLLARSNGLVFPSLVEGFGLPLVESARLGVPILCNDLKVYHEILGDIPIYVKVNDRYLWKKRIGQLAEMPQSTGKQAELKHLSWDAHFKSVLSIT